MSDQLLTSTFKDAHLALHLCNRALTEIQILSRPRNNEKEKMIVSSLKFYLVTLQYCFNSEYTKLLENKWDERKPKKNSASLFFLNDAFLAASGEECRIKFEENQSILYSITRSDFYKTTYNLRNKKFSHKDLDSPDPFAILGLTDQEITIGFDQLNDMYQILHNMNADINRDIPFKSLTGNFVKYHAVYHDYYSDHLLDAIGKGYSRNKF